MNTGVAPALKKSTTASYPIRLRLRYEISVDPGYLQRGEGWTVSLSNAAVIFETSEMLPIGKPARLRIEWPVKLQNHIALTFNVEGTIVQVPNQQVGVVILRHEFRTRPAARGAAA